MSTDVTRCLSEVDFSRPIDDRYFEDYSPGAVYEYGYVTVSEADIIEFATRFDPQPMHVDPELAASGPFGGLIASGWHVGALCMRVLVDHYLSRVAGLASPGLDELRWHRPVRPGDELKVRTTTASTRQSRTRSDRGVIGTIVEAINQDDDIVSSMKAVNLVRLRPA